MGQVVQFTGNHKKADREKLKLPDVLKVKHSHRLVTDRGPGASYVMVVEAKSHDCVMRAPLAIVATWLQKNHYHYAVGSDGLWYYNQHWENDHDDQTNGRQPVA